MSPLTLVARNISLDYGTFRLNVENFELEAGKVTALLGPSGSGKSTILNVMAGLEAPDSGQVSLDGRPLSSDLARRHVTAMFQTPYLMKGTVGQNVSYGLKVHRVAKAERAAIVEAMLALVGLEGSEGRSVLGLSGGEAQRVTLARALAIKPDVILLDEPLSSLDENLRASLSKEFVGILRQQKVTALYVTHSKEEAFTVADTVAIMREGHIEAAGLPQEMIAHPPSEWVRDFLRVEPWWERYVTL